MLAWGNILPTFQVARHGGRRSLSGGEEVFDYGCPRDRRDDGKSHYCEGYKAFFAATTTRLKQLAASLRGR